MKKFACPICGGLLSIFANGYRTYDDGRTFNTKSRSIVSPKTGLRGIIVDVKYTPRCHFLEDPEHGKVVCIENEHHEIPPELLERIETKTKEKRNRVPFVEIDGGIRSFKDNPEVQEEVFNRIAKWYEELYPLIK